MKCNITILVDDLQIVLKSLYEQPYKLVCQTISRVQSQYEQMVAEPQSTAPQSSTSQSSSSDQNSQAVDQSSAVPTSQDSDSSNQSQ
jgi:hypothetical protein